MNLDNWAGSLASSVYEKWKSDYSFWKPGFKIFYSPVRKSPDVMIISLNPGGNGENFRTKDIVRFEQGDFSVPIINEYALREYNMAKKIRKFFSDYEMLLDQSVAFPILFFRSKNFKEWKLLNKEKRREMEKFSYEKVKEIVKVIKPKIFLVIGFSTYRKLKKHVLDDIKNEKSKKGKNGRIFLTSEWDGILVFCLPHLTGARISNGDFNKAKETFFRIIKL